MIERGKNIVYVNYAAMEPRKMLERYGCRYTHFMKRNHNSFDEFKVIYDKDAHLIIFSDQMNLSQAEQKKYADVFVKIANSKWLDGKQQDKRFEIIKNVFGDDGTNTALDMHEALQR